MENASSSLFCMKLKKGNELSVVHGSTLIHLCGPMCEDALATKGEELAEKVRMARATEK